MERKHKTSYGLDWKRELTDRTDKDWEYLGAVSVPCIAEIPPDKREDYLPTGELQRGVDDFMDCASRAPLNILEMKFNHLLRDNKLSVDNRNWLNKHGYLTDSGITFSDRFVAINSGTTKQGNSLKAPCEAIRKHGLIPKAMLPAEPNMTWADYHNEKKITKKMQDLGKEFAERFTINYERVYEQNFGELLERDVLDVAGYAWPKPKEGVYPRVKYTPNHAFMAHRNAFYIFDNYIDSVDGDWIKHLARDYDFMDYGYRVYIARETKKNDLWSDLYSWLLSFFSR